MTVVRSKIRRVIVSSDCRIDNSPEKIKFIVVIRVFRVFGRSDSTRKSMNIRTVVTISCESSDLEGWGNSDAFQFTGTESKTIVILKWLQLLSRSVLPTSARPDALLLRFARQRESLQRQYFERASSTGLPRGLHWLSCEWLPAQILLRDRATKQPNLLVSINLRFEAIPGGDMEEVAAVNNIRDACAVFQWQNNAWTTSGRTLFNMNPEEARQRLAASYEAI